MRIGVISDTHGLLRPEALAFLQGSDRIVHGGDIGDPRILDVLAAIAPLTVVRGNNDGAAWADGVPETALLEVGGLRLLAIHDLALLRIDPVADGIQVVVSGHSHRPLAEQRGPVLYLNPGSAGPRRFKLPISVAELRIEGDAITPRLVSL
ncbi:metallophosphoesterase family protein [Variovorax sp. J31P179]|jgi:putative phosphoesterase|uniref:metallophosphoesterase family protein n=1 Tax=Variovorax sp. J31P179 TaxID=3053508 RepID=UPI002577A89C|nr:metallophosphoesterase family protein [Variovorax sp. J31P179]MDM0082742.1 metallophosphoesterase family protein [Variovorax sp. J31P179]